jgi:bisphosphoglycerate-dependent phosphoglycerate mutase
MGTLALVRHGQSKWNLENRFTGWVDVPLTDAVKNLAGQCPDCGNLLVYQEGCYICPSCGFTKC